MTETALKQARQRRRRFVLFAEVTPGDHARLHEIALEFGGMSQLIRSALNDYLEDLDLPILEEIRVPEHLNLFGSGFSSTEH